jgi:hypothetical protein
VKLPIADILCTSSVVDPKDFCSFSDSDEISYLLDTDPDTNILYFNTKIKKNVVISFVCVLEPDGQSKSFPIKK